MFWFATYLPVAYPYDLYKDWVLSSRLKTAACLSIFGKASKDI